MKDFPLAQQARALLLGLLLPTRLGGDPPSGAPKEGTLLETGPQETLGAPQLEAAAEQVSYQEPATGRSEQPWRHLQVRPEERITSWVTSRQLLYASMDAEGNPRRYSGRVYLPTPWLRRRPLAVPLVVYVHGTEAEWDNIPQFNRGPEAMVGAMAAYFHNLAVAMPDLPGYGHDPSTRPHPYCHAKSLALSILDLVQPALELLDPKELRWDGRLFLVGYSSGGYGALAAVKELQCNPRYRDLELTAAACMGGPFHFSESTRRFLSEDSPYHRPDVQAFLLRAYHDLYPETGVFAPERALNPRLLEWKAEGLDQGNLFAWLAGHCSNERICQKIKTRLTGAPRTSIPACAVMNPEWVATQLRTPAWPDTEVGRILTENDLVGGWHPQAPMLLATSPQDECVPASNTYALMEAWAKRGCQAKVELYPLTLFRRPLDHTNGATLALEKAFRWFASGDYATAKPKPLRSRL